ncbi:hypothetical protein CDAR_171221 [Caerostris darwini]|uniref:Uncharacterized protein n=1 Tax=Caerostris darwini TaxID=1538125 RepID=A0AAV4WMX0_9ARAC|nr:hypothetical protein CDAR_171221 [Caerostris darwini]
MKFSRYFLSGKLTLDFRKGIPHHMACVRWTKHPKTNYNLRVGSKCWFWSMKLVLKKEELRVKRNRDHNKERKNGGEQSNNGVTRRWRDLCKEGKN